MESYSTVSEQNQAGSHGTISVSTEWQYREQSSSGSVKKDEECLFNLELGKKRGRPAKRKSKKGSQPFALSTIKRPVVFQGEVVKQKEFMNPVCSWD